MKKEIPASEIHLFITADKWEQWLEKHCNDENGIWLQFYKKNSKKTSIIYPEALQVALCYGWIDGQSQSLDEESYLQRFTPRRAKSMWSKINRGHSERLIKEGKMKPSGMKQIEAAKADGRWDKAYDSAKDMKMPADFLKELAKNKKAQAFFASLNKSNTYAIGWRLQTAKNPETREKRMKQILTMIANGEKFH